MKNKKIFYIGIAVLAVISCIILVQIIIKNSENKADYKFENDRLYFTRDSKNWIEVPNSFSVTIKHLQEINDGKFREGTYQIDKNKIIFYNEVENDYSKLPKIVDSEGNEIEELTTKKYKYTMYLIYSDDNGETWEDVWCGTSDYLDSLVSIKFTDKNNGKMTLKNRDNESQTDFVTKNGGADWSKENNNKDNENKLNDFNYNVVKNTSYESSNSENNKVKSKAYKDKDKQWDGIFYEKKISDNIIIRVVSKGHILAQRCLIGIEKSVDGGNTWEEQIENADGFIQIHNDSKFVFLDKNIGFINDPGLAGTNGDNRGLLVTTDGGKTFKNAIIEASDLEDVLYIEDVPYMENNILKFKAYVMENSEKKYHYFYSEDNGLNWKIYK